MLVLSADGGAGTTTVTLGIGVELAKAATQLNSTEVMAMDISASAALGERVWRPTTATVTDLLDAYRHRRLTGMDSYAARSDSGLRALPADPTAALSDNDYHHLATLLAHRYAALITDGGAGLARTPMRAALNLAHQLVVVAPATPLAAHGLSKMLTHLNDNHPHLAARTVTALTRVHPAQHSFGELQQLRQTLQPHCRAIVAIPHDPLLEHGGSVESDQLATTTQNALLELTTVLGQHLTCHPHHGPGTGKTV
ncbi:MinD/ParA family ATP-binding protein [Actinomadura kijaniata]|uniref:MinD/ParA family ATP-binding protein n=1 Tax=Actinomadura kijaniata TaxID=46161 RepID=UPI003F1B2F90